MLRRKKTVVLRFYTDTVVGSSDVKRSFLSTAEKARARTRQYYTAYHKKNIEISVTSRVGQQRKKKRRVVVVCSRPCAQYRNNIIYRRYTRERPTAFIVNIFLVYLFLLVASFRLPVGRR